MKLFLKYFIKYLEIIHKKMQKMDEKHHFSELFYDFSWVIYGSFFMKNHEISPKIHHFGPKITQNR